MCYNENIRECLKTLKRGGAVSPGGEELFREAKCMKQLVDHSLEQRIAIQHNP